MPKFTVSRQLPFNSDQLFAIAVDVESYSQFLPLVRKSEVWDRKTVSSGIEEYDAGLTVTYKKLQVHETFISHVIADHNKKTVKSTSTSGPVKKMTSLWKIKDLPDGGAEIEYTIEYTLRSKTMQLLLSGLFDLALRRVMAAFEQRAHTLYDQKVA